jgi:hypothetical protein
MQPTHTHTLREVHTTLLCQHCSQLATASGWPLSSLKRRGPLGEASNTHKTAAAHTWNGKPHYPSSLQSIQLPPLPNPSGQDPLPCTTSRHPKPPSTLLLLLPSQKHAVQQETRSTLDADRKKATSSTADQRQPPYRDVHAATCALRSHATHTDEHTSQHATHQHKEGQMSPPAAAWR